MTPDTNTKTQQMSESALSFGPFRVEAAKLAVFLTVALVIATLRFRKRLD